MLPSIPVRVVALLQPGLTQTWETEVLIDGSETLEPLFPDQAQHQTPEWRLPVAGCEVSA